LRKIWQIEKRRKTKKNGGLVKKVGARKPFKEKGWRGTGKDGKKGLIEKTGKIKQPCRGCEARVVDGWKRVVQTKKGLGRGKLLWRNDRRAAPGGLIKNGK